MKKNIINIFLGLLFFFFFLFAVFSLTVLNKNFIYMVFNKVGYYEKINKRLEYLNVDEEQINKDLKKYVKSHYRNENFNVKNLNDEANSQYNSIIKFDNYFSKVDITLIIEFIYIITISLIIITGIVFNKTKNKHDLFKIIFINFIFCIVFYGILKVFLDIDNEILNNIKITFSQYYLAISIILFEIFYLRKLKFINKNNKF